MDNSILIVLAGLWIGLSKGGVGGPIAGPVLIPLLSQIMTVQEAIGITLPLLMFADVFAMRFYWREWDMRYILLTLPAAVIGIVIGVVLLASLSDLVLRRALGVLVLGILVYKFVSDSLTKLPYEHHNWHGYLAGWSGGFASALANAGGPPITAYLLLNRMPPKPFIGTITLFFFVVNWLKVPGYLGAGLVDGDLFMSVVWMLPIIPMGVWLGRWIIGWINPLIFERAMMILLVISAVLLLFDG